MKSVIVLLILAVFMTAFVVAVSIAPVTLVVEAIGGRVLRWQERRRHRLEWAALLGKVTSN